MRSLNEHVFLVAGHQVARPVFFDGHGLLLVIEFYDDTEHFLVIKDQADVRTDVDGVFISVTIYLIVIVLVLEFTVFIFFEL